MDGEARPDDEQCPKRGPLLQHAADGRGRCSHCDAPLLWRSKNTALGLGPGMAAKPARQGEQAEMVIPSRCARCLTVNARNSILCAWCCMEDSRRSHRMEGHTDHAVVDCPACDTPNPPAFL